MANSLDKLKLSKDPRFNSGICTVCGEHVDVLLHMHAQLHGFKDAYDQIKQGKYKPDWKTNYKEKIN